MHIRKKKWARPELEACPFYEPEGEERKNRWREAFAHPERPLHLEMGCGKGVSTAAMAADNPFEDVGEKDYFYAPVLWAVDEEITNGMDPAHFMPDNPCTRAQIVTFLYRDLG